MYLNGEKRYLCGYLIREVLWEVHSSSSYKKVYITEVGHQYLQILNSDFYKVAPNFSLSFSVPTFIKK